MHIAVDGEAPIDETTSGTVVIEKTAGDSVEGTETIEVEGKLDNLKNEMLHYTVSDIATAVRKNINYALLSGEFKNENNKDNL